MLFAVGKAELEFADIGGMVMEGCPVPDMDVMLVDGVGVGCGP